MKHESIILEELVRLQVHIKNLENYVVAEEGTKCGLFYNDWGPVADSRYEMWELAKATEVWLKEKVKKILEGTFPTAVQIRRKCLYDLIEELKKLNYTDPTILNYIENKLNQEIEIVEKWMNE